MRVGSAQVPYLADTVGLAVMAAHDWNSFAQEYRRNSQTGACLNVAKRHWSLKLYWNKEKALKGFFVFCSVVWTN